MDSEKKEVKSYKLSLAELEKLLADEFGSKLEPVNAAKLAKQRQQRARYRQAK